MSKKKKTQTPPVRITTWKAEVELWNKQTGEVLGNLKERLTIMAEMLDCTYFAIVHDKDKPSDETSIEMVTEDGYRRPHLHIVLKLPQRSYKPPIINTIASSFVIGPKRVSVLPCINFNYDIRYLTHETLALIGQDPKYKYNRDEIITNRPYEYVSHMDKERNFNIEDVINLVTFCNYNITLIMQSLGLSDYMKYRNIVNDLIRLRPHI